MRHFQLISKDVDVYPLRHALILRPELWNAHEFRRTYTGTPHGLVDDIWLRYSDDERTADPADLAPVQNDPGAVWHPEASELPEAKPLVLDLMRWLGSYGLERLLITRLAPGGRILPHADVDGTYVQMGDIQRYHVVVQGLPGSVFRCGAEEVQMRTGQVWWFDAHAEHEVINNSADDRIHLIADLRLWPC